MLGYFSSSLQNWQNPTDEPVKYQPLAAQEPRPPAFITRVSGDSLTLQTFGESPRTHRGLVAVSRAILRHSDYHLVSLVSLHDLCRVADPRAWTLYQFNRTPTRATFGGVPVFPLTGVTDDPMQLIPFYDALAEIGVAAAAWSTVARNMWRRTLLNPAEIHEVPGEWGSVGPRAMRRGRRETRPGGYSGLARVDLPAAFPTAMSRPVPTRLVPARTGWYDSGIARARVRAPDAPWTLLPWGTSESEGMWTYDELHAAKRTGHSVYILESWRGSKWENLFGEWFAMVKQFRNLPGSSGVLGKRLSNKLWGIFGMNPRDRFTRWTFLADGTPIMQSVPYRPQGDTTFLSAIIAGRVAATLLEEGLQFGAVACDTDCAIVPLEVASSLDNWVRKEEMARLEIVSQKAYRYKCMQGVRDHSSIDGCVACSDNAWRYTTGEQVEYAGERWHYVCEGILPGSWEAEDGYWQEWERAHTALERAEVGPRGDKGSMVPAGIPKPGRSGTHASQVGFDAEFWNPHSGPDDNET